MTRKTDNFKSQNKLITNQDFLINSLLKIMKGVKTEDILQSINQLDPYTKVASYFKLAETLSKLQLSQQQLQINNNILGLDSTEDDIIICIKENQVVQIHSLNLPENAQKQHSTPNSPKRVSKSTSPLNDVSPSIPTNLVGDNNEVIEVEAITLSYNEDNLDNSDNSEFSFDNSDKAEDNLVIPIIPTVEKVLKFNGLSSKKGKINRSGGY